MGGGSFPFLSEGVEGAEIARGKPFRDSVESKNPGGVLWGGNVRFEVNGGLGRSTKRSIFWRAYF